MTIIERMVQEIHTGKMGELEELDKRYRALEEPIGYPPLKRFLAISGPHNLMTTIVEREWESMAAMESAYGRNFADPQLQALHVEAADVIKSSRIELYMPM